MFVLEPPRWFARYGYRPLTELEREALWLVWKEVRSRHSIPLISQNGKLMKIEGIPETLAELERWSDDFAREAFRAAETNKQVADASIGLFLSPAPAWLHPLGRTLTACLMEPLLREAVCVAHPPRALEAAVQTAARCVGLFQRHFMLPRLSPKTIVPLELPVGEREFVKTWDFQCVQSGRPR